MAGLTLFEGLSYGGLAKAGGLGGTGMAGSVIEPPVISNVADVSDATSITVTWDTDLAADSAVEFWTDVEGYAGRHSVWINDVFVTSHSIVLDAGDGIVAGTYNYQVISRQQGGSPATSSVGTFALASGDPYWANVVLLAGNEQAAAASTTFIDQSGVGRAVTRVGNAVWSAANAPAGFTTWVSLPDFTDGLSIADAADLDLGSGDWTIDFYFRTGNAGTQTLVAKLNTGQFSFQILTQNAGTVTFYASSDGSSFDIADNVAVGNWSIDTLYHVEVGHSGTEYYGFLNGVAGAGFPFTNAANMFNGTSALTIGMRADGFQGMFTGFCSPVRITNGTCRHTAGFTPPSLPFLSS